MRGSRFARQLAVAGTTVFLCLLVLPPASADLIPTGDGSLTGFVYADVDNDGVRVYGSNRESHQGIPGVAIALLRFDLQGGFLDFQTTQSTADGAYSFGGLREGIYWIEKLGQTDAFIGGKRSAGGRTVTLRDSLTGRLLELPVAGTPFEELPGEVHNGQDDPKNNIISNIYLSKGGHGREYNFGEFGLRPQFVSKRFFLSSTPSPPPNPVPEPGTFGLLAIAALTAVGLRLYRRRSRGR